MVGPDDEKKSPMPDLPYVQTVSVVDMTPEQVEESIPVSAGRYEIEVHDNKLIVVKSKFDFQLKPSKYSIKEQPVAEVQTGDKAKKNE